MKMEIEGLRQYCLALPHSTETVQWGNDLVFKIGGKMYAVLPLEPGPYWLSFKCSPENFADLTERAGVVPAPYLARAQWVALSELAALTRAEVKAFVRAAYEMVLLKLPKKTRNNLG